MLVQGTIETTRGEVVMKWVIRSILMLSLMVAFLVAGLSGDLRAWAVFGGLIICLIVVMFTTQDV